MTVFIASLFLPYTIDFQATELRNARRRSSTNSSVDGTVGQLVESRRKRSSKICCSPLTPGATTDYEKIFKPYVSQSAGEIPSADEPDGPGLSEPRPISWGQSYKFNQPRSTAVTYPVPSVLSPHDPGNVRGAFFDGASDTSSFGDDSGSPHAVLSDDDWIVKAAEQGNGGLRNAVNAAEEAGLLADKVWVGTLGMPTDTLKNETRASISETLEDEFDSLTVFVKDREFVGHYSHYCRAVLWPALHYQMQESPRRTEYDNYSWEQYVKVNMMFAKAIAARWRPGDSIWINDYHLLLLPSLLREKLPSAEIGFFMHAAFPSSEVFRCLNARKTLLEGLLGADLLGFQIEEYCHHFLQTCSHLLRLEVTVDGVQLPSRFISVKNFPCGIDTNALDELRQTSEVNDWITKIHSRYNGKHLIVARDRLDAPGGIKQKLLAYELFLKRYPKWRDNVVLIQIASASELPELEAQVSKIAMRVNSAYSTLTHQPLVLLRHDISYSQFLALMNVAEIYIVSSLREGMNLASHDYLHCQDGKLAPQRHGSLILSEFTGSASIFSGHELLVNPWDYREVADTINKALAMSPEQKQRNWESLLDMMAPHTALSWYSSFQECLARSHQAQQSREPGQLSSLSVNTLKRSYENSNLRLIFLEDEGTFALANSRSIREPVSLVQPLVDDPRNLVYVTSNRSPEQLEPLTQMLPKRVGYIAENGCFKREIGARHWETLVDVVKIKSWRNGIRKVMEYFQERTDGSQIEERRCLLTFRYNDACDPMVASRQASELADQINGSRGSQAIRVVLMEGAVSVEPLDVTKARAAESVLRVLPHHPDFLFVAGGSRGDEALFRFANHLHCSGEDKIPNTTTLTVGYHATEAKAVLPENMGIADIVNVLSSPKTDGFTVADGTLHASPP